MENIITYFKKLIHRYKGAEQEPGSELTAQDKNVALVLGGGGARGYAQIGAIEVLLEHGYHITSVAGTSMGALVGGLYAAGKLKELKETVLAVNRKQVLSLIDVSLGLDHIATGQKLSALLDEMTGSVHIEDLPIPFCCSASDLVGGKEYVFNTGLLSHAIRASISIPGIFSPVRMGDMVLVDGSVHNTLPLNRVERHDGDLLIAVNPSAPDSKPFRSMLQENNGKGSARKGKPAGRSNNSIADRPKNLWTRIKNSIPFPGFQLSDNVVRLALRVAEVSVQNNTQMSMALNPPDICVNIPTNLYGLLDFDRGEEIIDYGRKEMEKKLLQLEVRS